MIRAEHALINSNSFHNLMIHGRLNSIISPSRQIQEWSPGTTWRQRDLTDKIDSTMYDDLISSMPADDRTRFQTYSSKSSAKWHGTVPSRTLDTALSNQVFVSMTELQLGVDVQQEPSMCKFCGMIGDCKGRHALSCMAGGDHVILHNDVRDEIFYWCERARLYPYLEKERVLHRVGGPDSRCRSIDMFICRRSAFLKDLPGGEPLISGGRVALDFAVINALGQSHHARTMNGSLQASIAYSTRKSTYRNTGELCANENLAFEPMVFEAQDGIEPRAEAILHRIAEAVAKVEVKEASRIKSEMLQRLATIIARETASAIFRRMIISNTANVSNPSKKFLRKSALLQHHD